MLFLFKYRYNIPFSCHQQILVDTNLPLPEGIYNWPVFYDSYRLLRVVEGVVLLYESQ